jgi:hypothetical protein
MKWQELSSTSHYQTAMAIKRVLQGGDVQEAITGIEELIELMEVALDLFTVEA